MKGVKKVEFRKRPFGREVSHVVVYASSPAKRVLGWFSVASIDEGSPEELWERYAAVGGIQEQDYQRYFGEATNAVAIRVGEIHPLAKPLELKEVFESGIAPQSYAYLSSAVIGRLRRRKVGTDWTWGRKKEGEAEPGLVERWASTA